MATKLTKAELMQKIREAFKKELNAKKQLKADVVNQEDLNRILSRYAAKAKDSVKDVPVDNKLEAAEAAVVEE